MRENYTLIRLYLEANLSGGTKLELSKGHRHYLTNVLRKSAGDTLRVFNCKDGEWLSQISDVTKKSVSINITNILREPKPCPDITLCFAPLRKHRNAFIAEKATELGVTMLQPVITQRTQFPKLNVDKMRVQVIEAAEQTERLDIPKLGVPMTLDEMLRAYEGRTIFFADEGGGARAAMDAIQNAQPAAILIGPEGGFTDAERETLRASDNVVTISLGPRILRADTAALSALTLWQSVHGDWHDG
ncbi:MAG: 16S rRNA (uracil(1498)-N(3))-methyltransferase [Litorimonas sp.]